MDSADLPSAPTSIMAAGYLTVRTPACAAQSQNLALVKQCFKSITRRSAE